MDDISVQNWKALEALVEQSGGSVGRVNAIRRSLKGESVRAGSPYTLLCGISEAGIPGAVEWLVENWFDSQVLEALNNQPDLPLVIGMQPDKVQPALGKWSTLTDLRWTNGHLLILRMRDKIPAQVKAQLQTFSYIDQFVLVTRMGRPIGDQERTLAQTIAPFAATARVLLIALPSEAPDSVLDDPQAVMSQMSSYVHGQMQNAGYKADRYLGSAVWYTDAAVRHGSLKAPNDWLTIESRHVADGLRDMSNLALNEVFTDLWKWAKSEFAGTSVTPISETTREDLTTQLAKYLADLGHNLDAETFRRASTSADELRAYALDTIQSWKAYSAVGAPGTWLQRVERLRPGIQARFLDEAVNVLSLLDYNPSLHRIAQFKSYRRPAGEVNSVITQRTPSDSLLETLVKRASVGLVVGLLAYLIVSAVITPPANSQQTALPPLIGTLMTYGALVSGAALGYMISGRLFAPTVSDTFAPQETSKAIETPESASEGKDAQSGVIGWSQIESRLVAWFSEQVTSNPTSRADEVKLLSECFGLQLEESHP